MKAFSLLVAFVCASFFSLAQVPQAINYQAVVRNNSGDVIKNQSVHFRLSITEGASGSTTYSETHQATTNTLGLVNLTIGSGTVASGTFAGINWASGQKFLKIEVDATGGTNYILMGSQQFVSVPYALNAQTATTAWSLNGNSAASNPVLGTTNAQDLQFMTNNSVKGVIKSNGQFGLGTTSPDAWMTLEKNGNGSNFDDDRNFFTLRNTSSKSDAIATIRINAGTNSSSTTLNHHSSAYNIVPGFANFGQLNNNGAGLILQSSNTEGVIKFQTGGITERLRIDKLGNVGIGTSNPQTKLSIETNASGFTNGEEPDGRFLLNLKNTSNSTASQAIMQISSGTSGNYMNFSHSSSTYLVNQNADCGSIWATGTGGLLLQASPKSPTDPDLGGIRFATGWANVAGGSTERMRIDKLGNVGIGTSTPKARLEVTNGDVYVNDATKGIILKSPDGNCWRITIDSTGNFVRTAISCPN